MVQRSIKRGYKLILSRFNNRQSANAGFLLPVVIVLGLAVGTVSVVALQSVAQNSVTLNDQYYGSVAREAAQAGIATAANCIRTGTATWTGTNMTPISPATGCNGIIVTGKLATVANDALFTSTYNVNAKKDNTTNTVTVTSVGAVKVKGPGGITVKTIPKSVRTFANLDTPLTTHGSKDVSEISTGPATTCAVAEGWAYCWGDNSNGQMGNGRTYGSIKPVAVASGTLGAEAEVPDPCGGLFQPACTRPTQPAQPASAMNGKEVTKISVGTTHTCAVAKDASDNDPDEPTRKAYCWGQNDTGQLGNRTNTDSLIPVAVSLSSGSALIDKTVLDISVGNGFSCALTRDNGTNDTDVSCWGLNNYGQLGNDATAATSDDRVNTNYPVAISRAVAVSGRPASALVGKQVRKLAKLKGTVGTMCVITTEDKAVCWGQNYAGQVGDGQHGTDDTEISSSGCYHGGQGNTVNIDHVPLSTAYDALQPVAVQTTLQFDDITISAENGSSDTSEGDFYSYVVAKTAATSSINPSRLYTWGGSTSYTVEGPTTTGCGGTSDKHITKATVTRTYAFSGPTGPLYNGTPAGVLLNQKPLGLISGNGYNGLFCAQAYSDIYCDTHGGSANEGQTGNGTAVTCTTNWLGQTTCSPTIPSGPNRIYMDGFLSGKTPQAMDTGDGYTCIVASQQAACWGMNSTGQLGDGTTANRFAPTPVDVSIGSDLGGDIVIGGGSGFNNPVSF